MTPEAQRIAVAEACPNIALCGDHNWRWFDGEDWHDCYSNDPLLDLNAMHDAEKVLTTGQHYTFRCRLWEITDCRDDKGLAQICVNGEEHNRRYASATAAQRAEAFLRTLGLWKDEL